MKKSSMLPLGIIILLMIIIIVVSLNVDYPMNDWIIIIPIGLLTGIVLTLFNSLLIPARSFVKYRQFFQGMVFGGGIGFMNVFLRMQRTDEITLKILTGAIVSGLIIAGGIYFLMFRLIEYPTIKKAKINLEADEQELFRDTATINNDDIAEKGVLILTNRRMVFVPNSKPNNPIEFKKDHFVSVTDIYRLGFRAGLFIPENNTRVMMPFPGLWKKELKNI